jgi:hypothetical protein
MILYIAAARAAAAAACVTKPVYKTSILTSKTV